MIDLELENILIQTCLKNNNEGRDKDSKEGLVIFNLHKLKRYYGNWYFDKDADLLSYYYDAIKVKLAFLRDLENKNENEATNIDIERCAKCITNKVDKILSEYISLRKVITAYWNICNMKQIDESENIGSFISSIENNESNESKSDENENIRTDSGKNDSQKSKNKVYFFNTEKPNAKITKADFCLQHIFYYLHNEAKILGDENEISKSFEKTKFSWLDENLKNKIANFVRYNKKLTCCLKGNEFYER